MRSIFRFYSADFELIARNETLPPSQQTLAFFLDNGGLFVQNEGVMRNGSSLLVSRGLPFRERPCAERREAGYYRFPITPDSEGVRSKETPMKLSSAVPDRLRRVLDLLDGVDDELTDLSERIGDARDIVAELLYGDRKPRNIEGPES